MAIAADKQKINPITPGYIQEYIDDLQAQKDCLKYDLDQANASLKQAQSVYNTAKDRKNAIEAFWNRILGTADLAFQLICELENSASIAKKVGMNTGYSKQGIEILARSTRELSKCWETLYGVIKDLLNRINNSLKGENALDDSTSIMKCLNDLNKKIDDAFPKIEAAIKATLMAFKCAMLLDASVHNSGTIELKETITGCGQANSGTPKTIATLTLKGILEKIEEMKSDLGEAGFITDFDKSTINAGTDLAAIVLKDDTYYKELKKKFEGETSKYKAAKDDLDAKLIEQTNKQAQYNSVCAALDAAKEAKNC